MYRLYGLPPQGHVVNYSTWANALPSHSLAAIQQAAAEAIAGGAPFDLEFEITWPDGSTHYLRSAARLVSSETRRGRHYDSWGPTGT